MGSNLLLPVTFHALLVLGTIVGISANIFIIFVLCPCNRKRGDANASDAILVSLAISSVCQVSTLTFNIFSSCIWPEIYNAFYVTYTVFSLTLYSQTSCVWLSACLFFFYFSKINTFNCRLLRWVKLKINTVVKWLILVSEIASVFSSSTVMIPLIKSKSLNSHDVLVLTNFSSNYENSPTNISFISACVPLFIIIITTTLSVVSLNLHTQKMEKNTVTTINENIKTYQSIVRNMFCLLLFFVIFYVSLFLFSFNVFPTLSTGFWMVLIVMVSFTPVQSVFLIVVTAKLQEAWIRVFKHIKEKVSMCLNVGL